MLLETQLMLLLVSHSPLCLLLFGPLGPRPTLLSALLASSSSLHDITFLLSPTPTRGGGQVQGSILLPPLPRMAAAFYRTSPARSPLPSSSCLPTSLLTDSPPAHLARPQHPHTNTFSPVSPRSLVSTGDDRILFQVPLPQQHSLPSTLAAALPSSATGLNTSSNNSMTSSVLRRLLSRFKPLHLAPFSFLLSTFIHFIESQGVKALKLERNSTLRLRVSQTFLRKEKLCVVLWDSTRGHRSAQFDGIVGGEVASSSFFVFNWLVSHATSWMLLHLILLTPLSPWWTNQSKVRQIAW